MLVPSTRLTNLRSESEGLREIVNAGAFDETHGIDGAAEGVNLLIGIAHQNLGRALSHQYVDTGRRQILIQRRTKNCILREFFDITG